MNRTNIEHQTHTQGTTAKFELFEEFVFFHVLKFAVFFIFPLGCLCDFSIYEVFHPWKLWNCSEMLRLDIMSCKYRVRKRILKIKWIVVIRLMPGKRLGEFDFTRELKRAERERERNWMKSHALNGIWKTADLLESWIIRRALLSSQVSELNCYD